MTPPQVALRQIPSQDGLIRLHPASGWDAAPLPGETPEEAAFRAAIDAATAILEAYDGGTADHSDDVLTVSDAIADRLNVIGEDTKHLAAVAKLHDIGKVTVAPEILNKPGPLNDIEWQTIRRHTIEGEQILAAVPEISDVAQLVRACHERYDGSGYPDGLAGDEIPLVARIVFCADAFHAMRCDRPYRAGRPAAEALDEIKANAGTQFDPVVVAALCDVRARLVKERKQNIGVLRSSARSRRLIALLAKGGDEAAAAALQNPLSALHAPVFGAEGSGFRFAGSGAGPAAGRTAGSIVLPRSAGSRGGFGTKPPKSSPRSGGNPQPRGVAHGVTRGCTVPVPVIGRSGEPRAF